MAILASFAGTAFKFVVYLFLACLGIFCGKKYRDHKDLKEAGSAGAETK